ncbi:HtaA domain-containing protein [Streptomyces formicae]|uniref:HtaA domain-containing protein n=1 Tax=Streptomyces formicae TaxID=1616117 RepID=A0ABY3WQ68_9ACTN|nr:HtaA domain-containing protein [Streptomyces formicae]UNM14762.1 HtaA domain-containing protein [Streptomyces formicae]
MAVVRRPVALGAVIATAVALGATGFAALPALAAGSAAPAAAPKLEIVDGTLDWGLKESFRKYVAGPIAHGSVTVADGATQAANNGAFTFTGAKGTYDTATHASDTAFRGSVHFLGHGGILDVKVGDIKVATGTTSGTITADFTSKKMDGTVVTKDDAVIADLDLTGITPGRGEGGATVLANIPAELTADGAEAFAGFYEAGTALDPATLSVKAAAPSPSPTDDPSSSPSPTGDPTSSPSPTGGLSPSSSSSTGDPSTTPSAPADGTIVDGNLDWGLKESFRTYVVGPIAGGKVELADGAVKNGEIYRFTKADGSFDAAEQNLSAEFDGSVRFLGHKEADGTYVLDLKLSGLQARVKNGKGTLVADVSSKDRETHKVSTFEDLPLASLDLPDGKLSAKDGVVTLRDVPAGLTADGAQAFAGFYEAGTELDKVSLSVALDEDAELPGGTGGSTGGGTGGSASGGSTGGTTAGTAGGGTVGGSVGGGSLASTGSDLPAGALLAASGAVAAAGAGVVVAVRRRQSAPQS